MERQGSFSKERVYRGRTLDVIHKALAPDAAQCLEFEFVHRPPVVMVIPFVSASQVIMIRQFRAAINDYIWEFPAGAVEQGETPREAANRELEEEVGYTAASFGLVREFYSAPHFSDEKIFLFVARNLSIGQRRLQAREFLTVHKADPEELLRKHEGSALVDAKTIIAYNYLSECGWEAEI